MLRKGSILLELSKFSNDESPQYLDWFLFKNNSYYNPYFVEPLQRLSQNRVTSTRVMVHILKLEVIYSVHYKSFILFILFFLLEFVNCQVISAPQTIVQHKWGKHIDSFPNLNSFTTTKAL